METLIKSLVVLLGGALLPLSLLACAENRAGGNETTINTPAATSPESEPTSSPTDVQTKAGDDRFSFHFEKQEVQLNANKRIVPKQLDEENSHLKFEISISFPQIEGSVSSAECKFNLAVASLARKNFNDYKRSQLKSLSRGERFPRYHEDVVEFLHISYDIPFATEKLMNVRFNAHTYGRGAAHSVQYFFVFNYDLTGEREIRLGDIFQPKSHYLSFISNYAREMVKKRICSEGGWAGTQAVGDCLKNPPLWEDGIKPKAENFEAWNITEEGLLLSFDACQLTGCAAGEFYVSVPYSELKKVVRPNSVISRRA